MLPVLVPSPSMEVCHGREFSLSLACLRSHLSLVINPQYPVETPERDFAQVHEDFQSGLRMFLSLLIVSH